MKKILALFLVIATVGIVKSQQDAQFSQNRFLNTSFNPGAVGIKGMDCFGLTLRQQWIGFEGRPTTAMLSYERAMPRYSSGLGAILVLDKIGLESNLFFKVNYARHISLSNGAKLGIGLDVGLINKQISGDILAGVPTDPNLVGLSGQSAMNLDVGFGAFYYTNDLYFGISGQKLVPQTVNWGASKPKIKPHTYFMGGYNYKVNANFTLKPSFLVKTDFVATQVDANLLLDYKNKVWGGASYRIQDAIVVMAGFMVPLGLPNPLKVGLAYDFTTQNLKNSGVFTSAPDSDGNSSTKTNNRSLGAVELFLGYCFVKPDKPDWDIYVDPLFGNN
mgnify:CR=1 FL=1